jgi:L-iditol 2-dehydrogenase
MARVIPLVQRGQIRVHELVTHHFGLSEYGRALATLGDRSTGAIKIILVP